MKRTGNLFERIVETENLLEAFHATQKGKADRLEVRRFREDLHANIERIRNELLSSEFQFGEYRHFTVHDPKTRRIQSAPFPLCGTKTELPIRSWYRKGRFRMVFRCLEPSGVHV